MMGKKRKRRTMAFLAESLENLLEYFEEMIEFTHRVSHSIKLDENLILSISDFTDYSISSF
jgi:hypothetical protein